MLNESYVQVLHIDLTTQRVRIARRDDLFHLLGGVGAASALYEEAMRPGLDALHPEQPVVLAIGPLNTIFPVVTKAVPMFRSPLNGELGESHAGGRIGLYDRATVLAALRSIGIAMGDAGLDRLARETMQRRVRIKRAFGFDFRALTAPARIYETPTMHGPLDPARVDRFIQLYADRIDALMAAPSADEQAS